MKIRYRSTLADKPGAKDRKIDENAPELLFLKAVCAGDTAAALGFFKNEKLFGGLSAVDAPYGRFEGIDGIRAFAEGFLARFHAVSATVQPVYQTRANGRSATELIVHFVVDGEIEQVSMFVVSDLRTQTTLDEVRIYCHFSNVPDLEAYRKPIFVSAHKEAGDPNLLTGAVREYYVALHHSPSVDLERILKTMSHDCTFGGYEPRGKDDFHDHNDVRKVYQLMQGYIPRWVGMRYETIIDDGVNCIIEWQHIVSDDGRNEGARIAISGVSSYERNADGLICSIRICDYAGFEKTINWAKTPVTKEEAFSINAVKKFPETVGCVRL